MVPSKAPASDKVNGTYSLYGSKNAISLQIIRHDLYQIPQVQDHSELMEHVIRLKMLHNTKARVTVS
jgi:hypothetical protein